MLSPTPPHGTAVRDSFLATVICADLIAPTQLARAEATIPADAETPADAARALVAAGLLTQFQADQLVAGRTDGFHLGAYIVLEQLGRGTRGRVYRAKHRTMNRPVAIKVLSSEFTRSSTAQDAFQREARAAGQLNHPNVVTTYDANEHAGRLYLVLELVDGPNLETLVRERGPLPVVEVCQLVRQIAAGLDHAHSKGMIHHEIKPANLLVTRPSTAVPESVVKIADFGIAKLQPAHGTTLLPGVGLPVSADYLSPEQAHSPRTSDPRADLYSLGAVMYFLLTGQPPFPDGAPDQKLRRHLREQPAQIERLRPDVPPAVAALLHQLLAKQPDARPSAAVVIERLDGLAAAAEAVCFDLPSGQSGQYSVANTQFSTSYPIPESSPWEQITTPPEGSLEVTPVAPSRPAKARSLPTPVLLHKPGTPGWVVGALALGMLLACMAGIAVLVNVMGK